MEKRQIEEQAKSSSSTAFNPTKVLSGKGGFVEDHEDKAPKFIPFAGGQRLDGKPYDLGLWIEVPEYRVRSSPFTRQHIR